MSANYTLHLGDCLEYMRGMKANSLDAVITDPPYSSGGYMEAQKNTKAQGLRASTVAADDFKWFAGDNMTTMGLVWILRSLLIESRRVLRQNRSAYIFTDWRMVPNVVPQLESAGLRYRNMLVWDKGNGGLGVGFRPSHEIILEFTNGSTEYADNSGSNVLSFSRVHPSNKDHNAQKPVDLIMRIIEVSTYSAATIFDPFMGSGTTGVAALQLGRRFIGCEIDPEYFAIAEKRISEAAKQPPLFVDEPARPQPTQGSLLDEVG